MSNDSIYNEIRELREQMFGISRKTETWKKLNERCIELQKKVGGQSMEMRKQLMPIPPVKSNPPHLYS